MDARNNSERLFLTAATQGGFFTAMQAKEAGYADSAHSYHVRTGNWVREWRGVYRLARYPLRDDWQLSLWGIWSMNRKCEVQGVYSHETALSIYDISDVNPDRLHMTVPRGFRRHSKNPPGLKLHFSKIGPGEYEEHEGYKVTKPFRTIADLVRAGTVQDDFIIQAVDQGLQKGVLTHAQYEELRVTPRVGRRLSAMMGRRP